MFQKVYLGTFCRGRGLPVIPSAPLVSRLLFGVNAGPDFDQVEHACWSDSVCGQVCIVQVLEWREGPNLAGRLPGGFAGWNVAEAWLCRPEGRERLPDKIRFDLKHFLEGF